MDTARVESLRPRRRCATSWRASTSIATPRDVARYIGHSQRIGVAQPFSWFSSPDNKNSTVYIGSIFQNGLTMPDRDYYLSPDAKYAQFRAKFGDVRRADAGARRRAQREVRGRAHRGAGNAPRQRPMDQGPEPRPGEDLQPDDAAGVPKTGAELRLAGVLRGAGRAGAENGHRATELHQGRGPAGEDRAGRRLAPVFQVPAARRLRAHAVGAVRRPRVRFPPAHAERRAGAASALAPRRGFHGQQHGRARRPHVRRGAFSARGQAPHARAGRQPAQGLRHLDRRARMDEPRHARRSQEEAGEDHREDRLSRQVARLLGTGGEERRPGRQRDARRGVRERSGRSRAPAARSTRASG